MSAQPTENSFSVKATPNPYRDIGARFAESERAELTRAEWEWLSASFEESTRLYIENSRLREELDRVKRIGRRVWCAARAVRRQMWTALQRASRLDDNVPRTQVAHWSIDLGCALQLDIRDAPPGHRLHKEFRR